MFAQVHFLQTLKPAELDDYLAAGWFRMGQTIFTTNFLNFKNQFYSAIWLRMALHDFQADKAQQKLIRQNSHFSVEIRSASITAEKEDLFAKYKKSVTFEASASLDQLLYGKGVHNIYNTFEIDIFDDHKLIAVGFFDIGQTSAAGISSFYDPDYKKFSLGKYLIFLKMNYCKKIDLQFFYPGYFVPGYKAFDYKLNLGESLQFFQLTSQQWIAIDSFSSAVDVPLQVMREKLKELEQLLAKSGVVNKLYRYEFFDANLIPDLNGLSLFDFPLFLLCFPSADEEINPIIIYDVRDHRYHLVKCRSIWPSKLQSDQEDIYCTHLLKIEQHLFSADDANEIVAILIGENKFHINS